MNSSMPKVVLKRWLVRCGLWYPLDLLRQLPAVIGWFANGCSGVPPSALKRQIIRMYWQRYPLRRFVETGTYYGETVGYMARIGVPCTSIELSPELHAIASERFLHDQNIELICGDSGAEIPRILTRHDEPMLFWLDGHYSAGVTATAELYSPIRNEINAILNHPLKRHVILIDDAHCFIGAGGYPTLDELLCLVRENGHYETEISANIIRLVPKV